MIEPMSQLINESMSQWINGRVELLNQWINEPMNRWLSESMIQRINESMNPWINDFAKQWTNEPTQQWISESMDINKSMNEHMSCWMDGWMDGWMDEWATSLLSYFCTERPLRWGASFFGYYFSLNSLLFGLLWAASQLPLLQLLQPNSLLCAAVTMRWATSSCNPAWRRSSTRSLWSRTTCLAAVPMRLATSSCNPECQECRSIIQALLHAAVPMCFFAAVCKPA